MSFDVWSRYPDGTLRNSTLTITRVQKDRRSKPMWHLDGWKWERVPEFPDDVREGYKRVEFSLGVHETLRVAKHHGEMYLRAQKSGEPRATLTDWIKVRDELEERIDLLDSQVQSGFWDDVFAGKGMDLLGAEISLPGFDPGRDLEKFADHLRRIAERSSKRRARERKIAKLANTNGRTPEEIESFMAGAAKLREKVTS